MMKIKVIIGFSSKGFHHFFHKIIGFNPYNPGVLFLEDMQTV